MRETLRNARKEKGMTQQQVADILKISLRHYKKIESAETLGSIAVWDSLEDIMGVHQRILREENHHDKANSQ